MHDPNHEDEPAAIAVFEFDPNTLSAEGWKKLGIKQRTIATIQNYLNKGGHFRNAGDLKRIYGLSPTDYQRLEQYVKIEAVESNESNKPKEFPRRSSPQTGPTHSVVDINNCDTSAFISLPGIGSKLASRIINFREKLGGFHSVEQIGEVYGVPDSTFQKLKPWLELGNRTVRKININTATVEDLKSHPYFGYKLANPIVAYRSSHGPFTNLDDIKKVMAVTEELYNKIVPYLTIE